METKPSETAGTSPGAAHNEKYLAWTVLLVTAATYAGTLGFDFVHDDNRQIVLNPFLRAWRYVPEYFTSSVWKQTSPLAPANYYRPLFLLLMRSLYSVFANRSLGWHLMAVGLHLVVTWLTYILVKKLTGHFTTAWLAALLFGLHPIHHEVVAWVSGTTESLFAILFVAAFLAYLESLERWNSIWMTLSCALYAGALLCKETAIVLPVLVFAHGWIGSEPLGGNPQVQTSGKFGRALKPAVFYLPIALLYLVARNRALSGFSHPSADISPLTWFLTLPSLLLFYIRNWFFPIRLSEYYDVFYQSRLSVAHVFLPALAVLAGIAAVWILRKRLGPRAVGYAAAWIVIPLLPALDTFVFSPDELVHDRYFYVPSIGAALLVALLIERAARTRVSLFGQPLHVVVTGLVITIALASNAVWAAGFWSSDYALFKRAHQIAPLNATATNNFGSQLIDHHEIAAAQLILEAGYRLHPEDYRIAFNLGRIQYVKKQLPGAEEYTQKSIALAPNFPEAYVSLGEIELRQGRAVEAQKSLHRAVELNPYSAPFHTSYGIVLALNGDCTSATQQFEAALALNPGEGLTEMQMARCRAALPSVKPPATKPGQL